MPKTKLSAKALKELEQLLDLTRNVGHRDSLLASWLKRNGAVVLAGAALADFVRSVEATLSGAKPNYVVASCHGAMLTLGALRTAVQQEAEHEAEVNALVDRAAIAEAAQQPSPHPFDVLGHEWDGVSPPPPQSAADARPKGPLDQGDWPENLTRERCPSCGAVNVFIRKWHDVRQHVECRICSMCGPVLCSSNEVVEAWNKLPRQRADTSAPSRPAGVRREILDTLRSEFPDETPEAQGNLASTGPFGAHMIRMGEHLGSQAVIERLAALLQSPQDGASQPAQSEVERKQLREAVILARDTFYRYRDLHAAKGPEGDDKARVNAELGDRMRAALTPPKTAASPGEREWG